MVELNAKFMSKEGAENENTDEVITENISDIPFSNPDASKIKFAGESDSDEENKPVEETIKEKTTDAAATTESGKEETIEEKKGENDSETDDSTGGKIEYTYEEFTESVGTMVSKISNGAIKSLDEIPSILEENTRLKGELEKPKEIPFPNEKAKLVYEYAMKAVGLEPQAAGQYIHIMQLEADKLSDKDAQFEAFHLTRPDLSRSKAEDIFNRKYEQKFADLETDLLQRDDHEVATREAKEKIKSMQKGYSEAKSEQPGAEESEVDSKQTEAIYKAFDEITSDFEGVSIQYGDLPEETLNVKLSAEEVSEFNSYLKEPLKLIQKIIADCSKDGVLDPEAYTSEMFAVFKRHEARQESFNLGKTAGQLKTIKEAKNAGKKEEKGEAATKTKKSFEETMVEAMATK